MENDGPSPEGAGASGGSDDLTPASTGPPAATPAAAERESEARRGRHSRRLLIGLVGGAVVIAALVVGIVLATSGSTNPFSPGDGSATITWTSVSGNANPPQPFGGTIDGLPVSGVATIDRAAFESPSVLAPPPLGIHVFEIKGTFDGKTLALGVYIQYSHSPFSTPPPPFPTVEVLGSYGHETVRANLTPPAANLSNPESINASTPILFNGTIGNLKVSGRIPRPVKNGADNSASATFTVK